MGQPFPGFRSPQLRIGKGYPYLTHLSGLEIFGDLIDLSSQECNVFQALIKGIAGTYPDPISFEVKPHEVSFRMHPGKSHRVFSFPTCQFQRDRMFISKDLTPLACHILRILKDILESTDLGESLQLLLSHVVARHPRPQVASSNRHGILMVR